MDKVTRYQQIIIEEMELIASRRAVNMPEVEHQMVVDEKRKHFIMVATGWNEEEYVHDWIFHLQIKDGKILIHEEAIDPDVHERLTNRGIPAKDIAPIGLPDYDWEEEENAVIA